MPGEAMREVIAQLVCVSLDGSIQTCSFSALAGFQECREDDSHRSYSVHFLRVRQANLKLVLDTSHTF